MLCCKSSSIQRNVAGGGGADTDLMCVPGRIKPTKVKQSNPRTQLRWEYANTNECEWAVALESTFKPSIVATVFQNSHWSQKVSRNITSPFFFFFFFARKAGVRCECQCATCDFWCELCWRFRQQLGEDQSEQGFAAFNQLSWRAGYFESQRQGQEVIWLDTHLSRHMHANDCVRFITPAWECPVAEAIADFSIVLPFK